MKQNDEAIFLLNLKKVIKMISELDINEFHRVLDEMTVEGTPSYKGNLLIFFTINFSDKPFYGFVSKNEFAISKNSNIKSMPYLIRGNFKKFEDLLIENNIFYYRIQLSKPDFYVIYIFLRDRVIRTSICSNSY